VTGDRVFARTWWNYRVVRVEEDEYEIREVYYDDDRITGFCHRVPGGSTVDELRTDLQHMLEALDKPALEVEDLTRVTGVPDGPT
jgi:hypothetical protein